MLSSAGTCRPMAGMSCSWGGGWLLSPAQKLLDSFGFNTALAKLLRGGFTDRPTFSIFTVVFVAWMLLTAYGWRLVGRFFSARRGRSAPAASA